MSEPRLRESHIFERDEHDHYVEPIWTDERLFDVEKFDGEIWDPACGIGRITQAAQKAGYRTHESDIADRGVGYRLDFLTSLRDCDNVISNPPYKIAQPFAAHALNLASKSVALLLPLTWLTGNTRARWLDETPLAAVWVLCPRPSMPPGSAITAGVKASGGTVDFAWFVWKRGWANEPLVKWMFRDGGV